MLVIGTSGSGKTTLASRIGDALAIAHFEIDGLFHGPNWVPRPSFESDVHRFSDEVAWVTEWQYSSVRAHLANRADLFVWLDLPSAVVMRQVVRRTLRRRLHRQRLWNGNVEPPLWTIVKDPEHIVRWAWTTRHNAASRVSGLLEERPDRLVVRLRSHEEAQLWLRGPLARSAQPST